MIDILIPTYNRAHTIIESIDSALNQINVEVQVHVVDNNSSDDTVQKIKLKYFKNKGSKFNNLHLHEYKNTVSMHMNWNRCLEFIKSKYFKFLFSDDLLSPEFCYECLNILEKKADVDFISTDLNYFGNDIDEIFKIRKYNKEGLYYGEKIIFRSLLSRNNISAPSNCLIRSSSRKNIEFVDNRVATDWIFFAEILSNNKCSKNYYYLEKPLAYFRTTGVTETNSLKMSANWIILNYEARKRMARIFKFHKRILINFFTLIYCSIVLAFIRQTSTKDYREAKLYLNSKFLLAPILYKPIMLLLRVKKLKTFFLRK